MTNDQPRSVYPIRERAFQFALRVVKVTPRSPKGISSEILIKQLVRAATSIGANLEEADGAFTKDEFRYHVNLARKEAKETHYWLRLIEDAGGLDSVNLPSLRREAEALIRILSAILTNSGTGRKTIGH